MIVAAISAGLAVRVVRAQNLLQNSAPNSASGPGSELEIPIPQGQAPQAPRNNSATVTIPSIQRQAPSAPRVETIPPANQGPGASTLEIPLPREFRGCWRGVVPRLDSIKMLGPPGVSKWIPKTYRICYEQTADGPFKLTLSETGLEGAHRSLTNVKGIMKVISTNGRTTARMRSLLHFDEPAGNLFGMFAGRGSVDELTNMSCRIDGGVMHVAANVYAQWNGRPWSEMTWHADFSNVP
ncbi:MAG: hypothetical protein ACYDC3_11705 [Candidatus Binataceae bacterium]